MTFCSTGEFWLLPISGNVLTPRAFAYFLSEQCQSGLMADLSYISVQSRQTSQEHREYNWSLLSHWSGDIVYLSAVYIRGGCLVVASFILIGVSPSKPNNNCKATMALQLAAVGCSRANDNCSFISIHVHSRWKDENWLCCCCLQSSIFLWIHSKKNLVEQNDQIDSIACDHSYCMHSRSSYVYH